MTGWIRIFRAGTHTDSSGRGGTWTAADLDRIVANFSLERHEPPLVLGHPKDNAPALGWVSGLRRVGDCLEAQFSQVAEEVKDWVRAGRFKKVSISLLPDLTLRHVGLLGAAVPAVAGLGSVAFSGVEGMTIEFSDSATTEDEMATIEDLIAKVTSLETQVRTTQTEVHELRAIVNKFEDRDDSIRALRAAVNKLESQMKTPTTEFSEGPQPSIDFANLMNKV